MPVLVLADLHLDIWQEANRDPFIDLEDKFWADIDALIIAGDLSNKPKVRWAPLLTRIGQRFPLDRVYVVPGNHDYYQHVLDDDDRLEDICTLAGAQFAQKKEVFIGSDRFLCCTLWTDFAIHDDVKTSIINASLRLNDYRAIRLQNQGYRHLRPEDTIIVHSDHRRWLATQLAKPFKGRTFVVTHHAPLPDLSDPYYLKLEPAYASNLIELIEKHQPDGWLYGHTHFPASVSCGRTMIRNVSIGYPFQNLDSELLDKISNGLVNIER